MLASLPEEKLLTSGEPIGVVSEPMITEVIVPVAPVVAMDPVVSPVTEDLFADLPVSPVENQVTSPIEAVIVPEVITTAPAVVSLPVAPITPAPVSTPHTDDCPSTAFYEQEHGVHHTSSHVGIFVVLGVLLLGIFGVGAWYIMGTKSTTTGDISYTISAEAPSTYQESIEQKRDDHARDIEMMNRAMSEQNLTLCASITDPTLQLDCSESVQAVIYTQSGILEDCQMLTLTGVRDRCSATLAQSAAFSRMDKTLCAKITSETQQLYCREEIDARVLANLIETQSATESSCASLEAKHREPCLAAIARVDDNSILQEAVSTDTLELCKKLSTEELKYTCFDAILMKRALISGDKNNCDYLHDEAKKTTCLTRTTIQDDNEIFKQAVIDKNLSLCPKIENATLMNRCHDSVTLLLIRDTKDATLCDTLTNTGAIASCKKMTPSTPPAQ